MTSPPLIRVACDTTTCAAFGVPRTVMLRAAALGVVEMPPLLCLHCRAHVKQLEVDVPKISRTGPTNANAEPGQPGYVEEESCPGSSSSTSLKKPEDSGNSSSPAPQSPARTTGSRSSKGRTVSRSARGTAGARDGA